MKFIGDLIPKRRPAPAAVPLAPPEGEAAPVGPQEPDAASLSADLRDSLRAQGGRDRVPVVSQEGRRPQRRTMEDVRKDHSGAPYPPGELPGSRHAPGLDADDLLAPELLAPDLPAPDLSAPDLSAPDLPASDLPAPGAALPRADAATEPPVAAAPAIWDLEGDAADEAEAGVPRDGPPGARPDVAPGLAPQVAPGSAPPPGPGPAAEAVARAVAPRTPQAQAASAPPGLALTPPRAGTTDRVRTRLIGFGAAPQADAFAAEAARAEETRFPVGWLVVVEGPGRGASFTLTSGLSSIGRGADQAVQLDFGDTAISRECHAAVAYDPEDRRVLVGHGGRSNIVRLNGEPLVSREEMRNGDLIRLGKTTLRFVAFCGPEFDWQDGAEAEPDA